MNVAHIFSNYRSGLGSEWGMVEFRVAMVEAVNRRKNFIIIILKDKLTLDELPTELRLYMKTHTYIDGTENTDMIEKILRLVIHLCFLCEFC